MAAKKEGMMPVEKDAKILPDSDNEQRAPGMVGELSWRTAGWESEGAPAEAADVFLSRSSGSFFAWGAARNDNAEEAVIRAGWGITHGRDSRVGSTVRNSRRIAGGWGVVVEAMCE